MIIETRDEEFKASIGKLNQFPNETVCFQVRFLCDPCDFFMHNSLYGSNNYFGNAMEFGTLNGWIHLFRTIPAR